MTTFTNRRAARVPAQRRAAGRPARWAAAARGTGPLRIAWLALLEARPVVQAIFQLRFAAAAVLAAAGGGAHLLRTVAGALVWGSVVTSVYLFNGVTDIVEDGVNASRRPIASGRLRPRTATVISAGLVLVAAAGAALLGPVMLLLVLALAVLGYLYSAPPFRWKRSPIGAIVATTGSGLLTYYAGFSVTGGSGPARPAVLLAASMSLWMGLVGSVSKDFSDRAGDAAAGLQGLAVAKGDLVARVFASIGALAVGAAFLVTAALWAPEVLPAAIAVAIGASLLTLIALTRVSRGDTVRCRRPYRMFMTTQHVAHIVVLLQLA